MRLLMAYLKSIRKFLFMLFICILIFAAVFSLYDLPVEAVVYGALLSFVIMLICGISDYIKFIKKHKNLSELEADIAISIERLGTAKNQIEQDYIDLIKALFKDKQEYIAKSDRKRSDMLDYYTLWVHQIKTPIAAMRLILQNNETEEYHELQAQLFKIEQYVEMVMAYLRVGSDSTDFLLKEYELEDMVKQTVRKYAPMFIRKKISVKLGQLKYKVLTDEKWLCFAIEQILSNAIKYTNKGYILIDTENETTLVISDTGIGISPEDLPRICEKGFTGYNGRTDKRASGIGLYLTKQILTKLGHRISFESQIGKGTKVRIDMDSSKY
ncbi:sensor histidine kinase [Herbinix luporum]|jgi:signal transduction histidine kinase|uniref:histidine kinase n=1 Tax=Herbinix luporum TaxID=1679721 RepID=A0A0K8J8D6_9FIRM|nr:sensor histidine kinase [Herbinix luporum]CUH93603.1 putative membrane protein [Herbinix luporum]HHT57401.1 HAMP domain-containing histidine kinase [Herbinix luporum]